MKKLVSAFWLVSCFFYYSSVHAGILFSDGFESGDLSHFDTASGASWGASNSHAIDSVSVSSENTHSGSYSLKFFFAGSSDLADDAWAEQRFSIGEPIDEMYIRFYVFFPVNYTIRDTPSTENTKLLYLWGDSYKDDMNKIGVEFDKSLKFGFKAKINGWPSNSPSCSGSTGYISGLECPSFSSILGKWACIEIHYKRDTGAGDGILQMWIDGNRVIDAQSVSWAGAPCGMSQFLHNGYLMGWSNSGFTEDTAVYIDDVVISDSYIGPIDGTRRPPLPPRDFGFYK